MSEPKTTFEDLKAASAPWNFNSDVKLFEYLAAFSEDLTTKTKKLIDEVDDLASEAADADVRLRNIFNEFLILADSQFIENRVYDDDGEAAAEEAPAAATTVDDPQVVIKESLQSGIVALKLYFADDAENDSGEKLEDIYNARPLPYIIGTKMYVESDDVGLGEEPLSFASPGADGDGDGGEAPTSSGAGRRQDNDDDDDYSAPAPPPRAAPPRPPVYNNDDDDDEDEGRDDFDEAPVFKPPTASRLPRPPIPVYTGDDDNDDNASVASEDSLFQQGPPSRMPPPRKPASYDDDNSSVASEDSLFRPPAPRAPMPVPIMPRPPVPSRSAFDDEDDDEEPYSPPKRAMPPIPTIKKPATRDSDLFDDDDANRDSTLSTAPLTKANIASTILGQMARGPGVPPPKIAPIVERDEDQEDDDESWNSKPPSRPPALPKPPMPPQSAPPALDDMDDDDDDIFTSSKDDPYSLFAETGGAKNRQSMAQSIRQSTASLFGDLESDLAFVNSMSKPKPAASTGSNKSSFAGLFDSGNDDSLFDSVSEERSILRATISGPAPPVPTFVPPPVPSFEPAASSKATKRMSELFGDDDTDFLNLKPKTVAAAPVPVASPSEPASKPPAVKSSDLFGGGGLFDDAPSAPAPAAPAKAKSNFDSLFDDEPAKPAPSTFSKPSAAASSRSSELFGDDDLDFLKPKSAAAPVSAPAPAPVPVPAPAPAPVEARPIAIPLPVPPKARASDLFDNDDNEWDDGSSSKPSVSSSNTSNSLASRIAGLDPSKIIMPGMSPPPKAKPAPSPPVAAPEAEADVGDSSEQRDSLAGANMERATMSRTRRAPSRKTFSSVAEEDEWGDGMNSFAAPAAPPLTMPKNNLSALFFGDAADPPAAAPIVPPVPAAAPPAVPAAAPKKPASSLFGDDDILAPSSSATSSNSAATSRMSSLFDDAPVPVRSSVAASRPSLFDDGLFGGNDTRKSNLFGDPLFGGGAKPDKKKSLFDD